MSIRQYWQTCILSDPTRQGTFGTLDEKVIALLSGCKSFSQVQQDWFMSRGFWGDATTYYVPQALVAIVSVLGDRAYWRQGSLLDSHRIPK